MERVGEASNPDVKVNKVESRESKGTVIPVKQRVLTFSIPIRPQAKQRATPVPDRSTKCGFRVVTPEATRSFERTVGQVAWSAMRKGGVAVIQQGVAIEMKVKFNIALPKSLSMKEKNARLGQPHLFDPDNTNLCKAVEDGCQKVLYLNDNQIWRHTIEKVWSSSDSIDVTFTW